MRYGGGNERIVSLDYSGLDSASAFQIIDNRLIISKKFVHVIFKAKVTYSASDRTQKLKVPREYWDIIRNKLGFTGNWVGVRSFGLLQTMWSSFGTHIAYFLYTYTDGVYIYWFNRGSGSDKYIYIDEIFYC